MLAVRADRLGCVGILSMRKLARNRKGVLNVTQPVQTIICLNGIANGSGFTSQQPTAIFENLPYGPWGTLSSPRAITGRVIGFADPTQYKIALFAVESRGNYTGNEAWLVDIAADGTFQMSVELSATLYVALLMASEFASSYFSQTFPSGSGTVTHLPTPADNPDNVLLMLEMPAGLNRSIVLSNGMSIPELAPGQNWVNTEGYVLSRSVYPQSSGGAPNPNQMTPQSTLELWQMMLNGNGTFCLLVKTKNPDGSWGSGGFAAGVYVYLNTMYLVAGAGPLSGSPTDPAPIVITAPLVEWQVFAPSLVQLNMTLTILPERVMLSMDVMEVEPSLIFTFLKLLYQVEKKLMELMFADI